MRKLNILVVDDDRDNADSMGELFAMEGHRPHVVYRGIDAIKACHEAHYDISFLDVMMPGMNGVESFLEIRRFRPNAQVFMMSGYSVEELLQQAVDRGALGVLSKPVPPETILKMVQSIGPNGLVVAQGQGPAFTSALSNRLELTGAKCQVVKARDTIHRPDISEVMILDTQDTLIDSVCRYTSMRKTQLMPPTVILAQTPAEGQAGEAMANIAVTGILNKPFDPEALIDKLNTFAA